jgi:hypothetical protein
MVFEHRSYPDILQANALPSSTRVAGQRGFFRRATGRYTGAHGFERNEQGSLTLARCRGTMTASLVALITPDKWLCQQELQKKRTGSDQRTS